MEDFLTAYSASYFCSFFCQAVNFSLIYTFLARTAESVSITLDTKRSWLNGINLCSYKEPRSFSRETLPKQPKYIDENKNLSKKLHGQFQPNILDISEIKGYFSDEGPLSKERQQCNCEIILTTFKNRQNQHHWTNFNKILQNAQSKVQSKFHK